MDNGVKEGTTFQEKKKKGGYSAILLIMGAFVLVPVGIAVLFTTFSFRIVSPMSRGDRYLNEKEYVMAAAAYREALKQDPKNADAYQGLADAYEGMGDEDAALHTLEKGYEKTGDGYLGDQAEALREDFGPVITGNSDKETDTPSGEPETARERQIALLTEAYTLLSQQDYDAMCSVDGSAEADQVIAELKGDHVIYIPEDDNHGTGTGCGVYRVSAGYFFYYGDYVNGERLGNGVSYWYNGHGYEIYEGEWKDDAPNGDGYRASVESDPNGTDEYRYGTFRDGVEDGDFILYVYEYHSTPKTCEYTVNFGRPAEATKALEEAEEAYNKLQAAGGSDYNLEQLYYECLYNRGYNDQTIYAVFPDYSYRSYYRYGEPLGALGYR